MMRHIIFYLATGAALAAVVCLSACDLTREKLPFRHPPNGTLPEKQVLISDCARAVGSEQGAVELVTQRLGEISAVELIRIPGGINRQTLLKIRAQDFERYGEPAFLVYIDYKAEDGSGYDVGTLVVEVTTDGKIYGYAGGDGDPQGD